MNRSHLIPEAPRRGRKGAPYSPGSAVALHDFAETVHQPADSSAMNPSFGPYRGPRKLVLCFDGTGNKFRGDDSDSNILKIFRCLDREAGDQYHYYQPGIGTYIISSSLSHTSVAARLKSWYLKAKDSAVGSSFDQHVVGGYKFLMRFYNPGDEIYFFGFSRGAYVARFLAEMLDYVGLLSHGNEEMIFFAWKAFSQWQSRQQDDSPEGHDKRHEMYQFLKGFRETFSRPVKRIRFLGLFDTVNSVPRFEAAWMQRSKFPYTARSSAKVIRHCVSIDERRAKFRQDLMYQKKPEKGHHHHVPVLSDMHQKYRARRPAVSVPKDQDQKFRERRQTLAPEEHAYRPHSRSRSRATRTSVEGRPHTPEAPSEISRMYDDDSDDDEQDIDELWFAGGHADVGGGWEFVPGVKSASHIPLVYLIKEAEKAGLSFDPEKLVEMGVSEALMDSELNGPEGRNGNTTIPDIHIDVSSPSPTEARAGFNSGEVLRDPFQQTFHEKTSYKPRPFHEMLHKAHVSRIHDSLEFSSGLGKGQVMSWKIMEYMPFRRMDLRSDGSWKPIRWPLPGGETRDIPHTARIHGSVIRRMKQDPSYRPGNLIVGGGGRGVRVAPDEYGIGEWECVQGHGDPVGEVWVRKAGAPDSIRD
ncbi:hypothetical protein F5Y18DRAFT_418776 [Xylariaceae sp. FL1019]|nr:hypothetical protein F5Y18DRAFT_418776 [Xylariaceae sp. FL1019]